MTEPIGSPHFERWWALRIPDNYRNADRDNDWTFKTWLMGVVEQLADVETLLDRIDYLTPDERDTPTRPTSGEDFTLHARDTGGLAAAGETIFTTTSGTWTADGDGLRANTGPARLDATHMLAGGDYLITITYPPISSTGGDASVVLDGVQILLVDCSNPAGSVTVAVTDLDAGAHTFSLLWTGLPGPADDVSLTGMEVINTRYAGGVTSDLVDPLTADAGWLPWLAQLIGITRPGSYTTDQLRDLIRFGGSQRAGTKQSMEDAASTVLTGTRYASVRDHSDSISIGSATMWDVAIITRASETPAGVDPAATITALGVKPAGVILHNRTYSASWDTIESLAPTWDAVEALGTWVALEEVGLT